MKIDATDTSRTLVEADVVEAFEARARNGLDFVVRNQEVFLPSHEQVLFLCKVLECE